MPFVDKNLYLNNNLLDIYSNHNKGNYFIRYNNESIEEEVKYENARTISTTIGLWVPFSYRSREWLEGFAEGVMFNGLR